jgi:SAM-dependent methyltransferase
MSDNFWTTYQPGFRSTREEPGSPAFFAEVERERYELEPHIPELARFESWQGRQVLDAGCGIATDGLRFARAGADYTGIDRSATAIDLARVRFEQANVRGTLVQGSITQLPFEDESFDLVYSNGVVHHIEDTQAAIDEYWRVLRPGGQALVMVYHRNSINYRISIMAIRRFLAVAVVVPGAPQLLARMTGERNDVIEGHRALLRRYGLRYLRDKELFLSNNTDGPGNPLSKVYSREEGAALFSRFSRAHTEVRYLNLRLYPGGRRFAATQLGRRLERRWGWHLYIRGEK